MRFYEFYNINEDVGHIYLKFREQKAGKYNILQAYWGPAGTAKELKYAGSQFQSLQSPKEFSNLLKKLSSTFDLVVIDSASPLVSKYKDIFGPVKAQIDAGEFGNKVRIDLRGHYTDKMNKRKTQTVTQPELSVDKPVQMAPSTEPNWSKLVSKRDGLVRFRLGPKVLYDAIWQSENPYLNQFIKRYEFDAGEKKINFFQMTQEEFKKLYSWLTSFKMLTAMQNAVDEYSKTSGKIRVFPKFIPAPNPDVLPEVDDNESE